MASPKPAWLLYVLLTELRTRAVRITSELPGLRMASENAPGWVAVSSFIRRASRVWVEHVLYTGDIFGRQCRSDVLMTPTTWHEYLTLTG